MVGGAPPPWLGKRVLPRNAGGFGEVRPTPPELVQRRFTLPDQLPALPGAGFASVVETPVPAEVLARSTWKRGCPVAAADLSWVRLAFWGFDNRRHTGELLVNSSVDDEAVTVFRRLYAARFPIEEMRITRRDELDAPPTGDGNNTGAFNCRPTTGGSSYSQHAYGLAVDVNPFQNPYVNGDVVIPELSSSYLDRGWVRPGMITAAGPVVRAFDAIGWTWGGTWQSLKDIQHFSQNGR
ncbi:MAG: family peptidase [Marmoricola sp.]|nr:family peptidase [Marmoricola sp.]